MTQTTVAVPAPDLGPVRELLANWPDLKPRNLIAVLQRTQDAYGYLPMEALDHIADTMRISEARVFGVATFYSQFRLKPQGEHVIQVCNGTACNVKGADDLIGELVAVLGIQPGDTTPDGKVTLEKVNCVGACGVAPAVVIDGEVHGRMTGQAVGKLARRLLTTPRAAAKPQAAEKPRGRSFLERCCDQCKNRPGTPCPDFLLCRMEGESCHEDEKCQAFREELRHLAEHSNPQYMATAFLCKGLTCDASDEPGVYKTFLAELKKRGLSGKVDFLETGCQGLCEGGPIVQLAPLEAFYCRVKPTDVAEIIDKHIVGGQIVERLLYAPGHVTEASIPFYSKQVRRVLSNCGKIDPENIDEYFARDGYRALYRALKRLTPEQVIEEVTAAAKQAYLHDQIVRLPNGYSSEAQLLSGGQQQRIAIARLFLKDPPVLFLDEPTASLDAVATEQIKNSLDAIKENRTVVVISHSISQIIDSDMIYVLKEGSLVETGTHADLYDKGGAYFEIFNASARSLNLDKISDTLNRLE